MYVLFFSVVLTTLLVWLGLRKPGHPPTPTSQMPRQLWLFSVLSTFIQGVGELADVHSLFLSAKLELPFCASHWT